MRSRLLRALTLAVGALLALAVVPAQAAPGPVDEVGTIDGAPFQIQIPAPWNGTLVLFSHGYEVPGQPKSNPTTDAPDAGSGTWLLDHGYALAASGYSQQGWALQQAFHDQIALLDHFTGKYGKPDRTVAWGESLGGIITAGLVQLHPDRFAGAAPLCGVLAGGVGVWNEGLDGEFAIKTLLAPSSSLQLVNIPNPTGNYLTNPNFLQAEGILAAAQATPQGRARLALAAALGDLPGWYQTGSPEPAPTDYTTQESNQFLWFQNPDSLFSFSLRSELEARAGGNPSWNTGVNYFRQLDRSIDRNEVRALYEQAGLNLEQDLRTLNGAPRITADPAAVAYLEKYIVFNGQIHIPVLTMHTIGDGLVLPEDEQAYASVVRSADNGRLLRQTFVQRAGHCAFTSSELVSTFQTLVHRIDSGRWDETTTAGAMNATAAATGLGSPSAFVQFRPGVFLRPFDARSVDGGGGGDGPGQGDSQ
jgi:pimeloyl-ACP methyl ester carboxylesterase